MSPLLGALLLTWTSEKQHCSEKSCNGDGGIIGSVKVTETTQSCMENRSCMEN